MEVVEVGEATFSTTENAREVCRPVSYPGGVFELQYKSADALLSPVLDPFLAATLLSAMKLNATLQLRGTISPKLLASLGEISQIVAAWNQDLHAIRVAASPSVARAGTPGRQVGCFFTGGMDSWYSTLKHRDEIDCLIFVHGFDMKLPDRALRTRISADLQAAAAEFGKPLIEIETNLHEFSDLFMGWEWYHGAALASVALILAPRLRKVFVPSTHSYADLVPWGSHPLLDRLWGTEDLEIVHDGCEATRIEKVALLAANDVALNHLRVCFQNNRPEVWDGAYNCGQCEKCVRTKINLQLVGALERCPTLDHTLDFDAIARMQFASDSDRAFVQENLDAAERQGGNRPLILALRASLAPPAQPEQQVRPAQSPPHEAAVAESDEKLQSLQQELHTLKQKLDVILNSKSWRLAMWFRNLRLALLPIGSRREAIVRSLYRVFRPRPAG